MQEEIIVNSMVDITNIQEDDLLRANKLIDAIAENEQLKDRLEVLQKEVEKYPVARTVSFKDIAIPGLHVVYDAGNWDRTVDIPNPRHILPWRKYGFSMFTKGKSKNDSVMDYHGNLSPSGWRVLGVIDDNVYLIHAGIACVYYPNDRIAAATEIKGMTTFCNEEFANSPYTKEGMCATRQLFSYVESLYGEVPDDLSDVGAPYWLATLTRYNGIAYYDKYKGGFIIQDDNHAKEIYGIRPVVILKRDVKVLSGDGTKDNPIKLTL